MNEENIRRILIRKVREVLTSTPIALENIKFDPPEEGLWAEPFLLPSGVDSMGKGQDSSDDYSGIYQVSLYVPIGTGTNASVEASQELSDVFIHGTELTLNGVTVFINKTEVKQGFRTGAYWHTPVQIFFNSYIKRK